MTAGNTLAADRFAAIVEADPLPHYAQFGLGLSHARLGDSRASRRHLRMAVLLNAGEQFVPPGAYTYRRRRVDPKLWTALAEFSKLGSPDRDISQSIANLLMLAPLGLYGPLLWPRMRSWKVAVVVGTATSLAVESLQLGISTYFGYTYKVADADSGRWLGRCHSNTGLWPGLDGRHFRRGSRSKPSESLR